MRYYILGGGFVAVVVCALYTIGFGAMLLFDTPPVFEFMHPGIVMFLALAGFTFVIGLVIVGVGTLISEAVGNIAEITHDIGETIYSRIEDKICDMRMSRMRQREDKQRLDDCRKKIREDKQRLDDCRKKIADDTARADLERWRRSPLYQSAKQELDSDSIEQKLQNL